MSVQYPSSRPVAVCAVVLSALLCRAAAASEPVVELLIRNHQFEPATVKIPAQTKVKIVVKNLDATPEEFESYTLKREKIVPANASATLFIGPLAPGNYPFVGEFNEATAKGEVVVE
ncbi:MAG: cupredoxin domain-containing protein [Gammaproteobacteria bacterium]|nr:cupredoxin domain-containing protein [Gammaproteobacteria bacterium]